jgi:hypothetical protein
MTTNHQRDTAAPDPTPCLTTHDADVEVRTVADAGAPIGTPIGKAEADLHGGATRSVLAVGMTAPRRAAPPAGNPP